MGIGVWSANNPYLPPSKGQLQCGDPPELAGIAETVDQAGLLEFDQLSVVYKCPEGQQLEGPSTRTCGGEGQWEPGKEEKTSCHQI